MPLKAMPLPREESSYLLLRTLRPVTLGLRSFEARPGHKGLGVVPRAVLDILRQVWPRPVPFLAGVLMLQRQPVQRAVNELLAKKLIARTPNPYHRRSSLFELTAAGRAELKAYWTAETKRLRVMLAPFSDEQVEVGRAILEHLRVEFSALHSPQPGDRLTRSTPPAPLPALSELAHDKYTMRSGWSEERPVAHDDSWDPPAPSPPSTSARRKKASRKSKSAPASATR